MVTWAELNKGGTATKTKGWDDFNSQMSKQSFQQEARSQKGVDPALFARLREGSPTAQIKTLEPEKTSFLKQLEKTTKETVGGLVGQMFRNVRGVSQVLATPIAGVLAQPKGGATPIEAMKESLRMAKDVLVNKNTSIDKGVEDAAEMWLKNRGVGKYGGKEPDIADVAALGMLGFFNLFGDPAFEVGLGLRGVKALKELATFKKVGSVTKELPEGAKIIEGIEREIKITDDLKVKVKPKEKSVVFEGYKRRFSSQSALPDNQLAKETQDLIVNTREATGMELTAKFEGDDLVLKPTTPVEQAIAKPQPETIRNVRAYIQTLTQRLTDATISDLEKTRIGVDELPFDREGNITLYREGEIRPGQPNSFSLTQKSGQVPYVLNRKDILLNTTSSALKQAYSDTFAKGLERTAYTEALEKFNKLEGEVIALLQKRETAFVKPPPQVKQSTLGIKVKEKAIEEGLAKRFQGLPEYEVANMKEQAEMAAKLINSDFQKAKRVAMGEELPDGKLLPESVFVALEKHALDTGNISLIRQLARSHTVEQATFMGQRIRALGERTPNNPVQVIREIESARAKKLKGPAKQARKEAVNDIKKEIKPPKKDAWEAFIADIKC